MTFRHVMHSHGSGGSATLSVTDNSRRRGGDDDIPHPQYVGKSTKKRNLGHTCRAHGFLAVPLPDTLLCAPKDPKTMGVHTKRKAACVATSGPSLGRKRPRRAAIAGGRGSLPHAPS